MKKKIIVCGSIGYGGIDKLMDLRDFLIENQFLVIDHISEEDMDYSDVNDFREKRKLSEKIVKHDLEFIDKADILVVITEKPSFGTAIEMHYAFEKNKIVILYSENPIPTPWPIHFSNLIVKSKKELIETLKLLEK